MLERVFRLRENGTSVRTELVAGVTTFLTMAYIIFVQAGMMSGAPAEMDFGAVVSATCLASALASALMGLWARYPIALAPGMGLNAFFVFTLVPAVAATGHPEPWRVALGVVFMGGALFVALTAVGARERVMNSISPSLKNAIAAGIGLFIAFVGLRNGGLVVPHAQTAIALTPRVLSPDVLVFLAGLLVATVLHARSVRGSILWGIAAATLVAMLARVLLPALPDAVSGAELVESSRLMTEFRFADAIVSAPPSLAPTFFAMDLAGVLQWSIVPFVVIFLFTDLFDTMGTLVGISEQAGFIRDNRLPRAGRALGADAVATVAGACLGTSTVTSYIESAAGVEQGGRTGLTSVTVAGLFLLAPFFSPVVAMVASYPPITAPALVLVGAMMLRSTRKIAWDDYSESVPAFLIVIGIPLFFSIGDGMALGLVAYPIVKLASGRRRDLDPAAIWLALVLFLYFVLVR